ncbi:hypothetical protein [Streptomyces venezuelae]|uniref:hypothetical protein n=1 Tax=Streptomyces venezuelae TaxID=54571 RepID=UPI003430BD9A
MLTAVPSTTAATSTVARLLQTSYTSDTGRVADAAIRTGLMWRCACTAINADLASDACAECGKKRPWASDLTPTYCDRKLLEDLRHALADYFDDRPYLRRPAAVSFRTTHYDDGRAWYAGQARLHYTDKRRGELFETGFDRTFVADALVELSEDTGPQDGAVLRVVVPAWGSTPEPGDPARHLYPTPHPLVGEYAYSVCDYAREAAQVLGDGWGSESGYIGAYGLIWGPGVPTLRLWVDHDDDLILHLEEDDRKQHIVSLPDGAPSDAYQLRAVAEEIARLARTYLP